MLVNCINTTKNEISIIGADKIGVTHAFIDASCTVHPNKLSHTGRTISLSAEFFRQLQVKQKLNVESSNEAKIVGTSHF